MTSVLFDLPGPKARARHRLLTVLFLIIVAAIAAWATWKLWEAEAITPDQWEFLGEPRIVEALLEGLLDTLKIAAAAIALSLAFGAVFAGMRLSESPILRWPAVLVVEFFRAVPVLLLILVIFFGFSDVIGRFWALVLALMLYNGSVLAEVFRAGVQSVPKGQSEAAYAVGMTRRQTLRLVLAPQAVRAMLPAIISQCVVALKDTALGFIIGAPGIIEVGSRIWISPAYLNPFAVAVVLAVVFIVINYALSKLAVILEARLSGRDRSPSGGAAVEGTPQAAGA
ncbi:amino acid ABC transporter permease [Nocardioides sp. SYSU DS0663]|uniref:amino acid ABC transporter permease n=1 Tax=Nocardioides sp. SYSU DS0663 TaxID=3416445 RepID=UPI003F4C9616